jgi:hypothetical protein
LSDILPPPEMRTFLSVMSTKLGYLVPSMLPLAL